MKITCVFGKRSPVRMAIEINIVNQDLIFFGSPRSSLYPHFLTTWCSSHFFRCSLKKIKLKFTSFPLQSNKMIRRQFVGWVWCSMRAKEAKC